MNQNVKRVFRSIVLLSTLVMSMAAQAEELGTCFNNTGLGLSTPSSLRAWDYTKVDGFLEYRSFREGWVQKYIPSSAEEEAYIANLDDGAAYTCRVDYEHSIRCVPKSDACHFNKNVPDIWLSVKGPIKDFGNYWVKEDEDTSCILNKRLDGTLDISVADCITPRKDKLDTVNYSFFDGQITHPSLGKTWFLCTYGFCGPDYKQIYVQ